MKPSSQEVYNELLDKIQLGVPHYEIENWLFGLGISRQKSQKIIKSIKRKLFYNKVLDFIEHLFKELIVYPVVSVLAIWFVYNFILCTTNSKLQFDNQPYLNELLSGRGDKRIYFMGIATIIGGLKYTSWRIRMIVFLFLLFVLFLKFIYFADIYDMFKL
jgi:hypothetical protein